MLPDRYFLAYLELHPLHYAAFRGQTEEVKELLATSDCNPYEPIRSVESALHVAIVEGQLEVTKMLIEQYRKDFELVGDYLACKYQLELEDKFWINRGILVAVSEEQCTNVKQRELLDGDLLTDPREGVLVLLKHSIEGEHAGILNPINSNRLEIFKLIRSIFRNGMLSWNSTGPSGSCGTFLALSTYHGHPEIVETLIDLGADLTRTNQYKRTPFHAACGGSKPDVIELLLTKHIDRFDPLALDEDYQHGLHYILYRKKKQSFKLALKVLINYHTERYGSSKSQAFNSIFKLEHPNWPNTSVWSQLNYSYWKDTLEEVCEKYQYDLSYQWMDVTVLLDLISYKKLRKYYCSQIRRNHQLLTIASTNGYTALHALISANEMELIEELYRNDQDRMTEIFEVDAAFATLTSIMQKEYFGMMEFILEKHNKFFSENLDRVCEQSISECTISSIDETFAVLERHLPQIVSFTSSKKLELREFSVAARDEFESICSKLLSDFESTEAAIKRTGRTFDDYNSFNSGRCLLHQAVEDDHLELVDKLLESGVDIDFTDVDQCHAIHHVRSINMLHLLVRKHPDGQLLVHRKDREGQTLLHMLCTVNCISDKHSLVKELLKLGANIDERTNAQSTVLHCTYDAALFQFLTRELESEGIVGIDASIRDSEGNTALQYHLRHRQTEISSAMLQVAESFVSFNDSGESILAYLIRFDAEMFNSVFKPILEANPEKTKEMFEAEWRESREQASKVFVEACMASNEFCVERMIVMDLDFDVQVTAGWTALLALLNRDDPLGDGFVERLLDKPLDLNLQVDDGRNAVLMLACGFSVIRDVDCGLRILKKMVDRRVDIDCVDQNGNSMLHFAFKNTQLELIEFLLESQANVAVLNNDGKMPYQLAPADIAALFQFLK